MLGAGRKQVVIATKLAMPTGLTVHDRGGSRRYILAAVEASLRHPGTDYIDLYVIPVSTHVNIARNGAARCIEPVGNAIEIDSKE